MLLLLSKKYKKIPFFLFTLSIFLLGSPITTHAGAVVWDPGNYVPNYTSAIADGSIVAKEFGLDAIAFQAANMIIKKITAQTVNWINSGFQGNPTFVTDPEQFFLDVADTQAAKFLSSNSKLNQLCTPFRANVRLNLVRKHLYDTNSNNYSCNLSRVLNNYEQFTQDFSSGGWEGWFEVTQNDSNNPYGAYLQAQSQLQKDIDAQVNKYNKQLEQGRGFLSHEVCLGTEVRTVSTGRIDCIGAKKTVTPGSVIGEKLNSTLGTGERRLEVADEIDEVLGALLSQLTSRVIGGVGGLLGSSQPNASGRSFTSDLASESENGSSNVGGRLSCTTDPNTGQSDCTMNPPTPPSNAAPELPSIPRCNPDLGYACSGTGSSSGGSSSSGSSGGGSNSGSAQLSCSPSSDSLIWNQQNTWGASGGDGTYSWSAPNLTITSGGGSGDRIGGYYPTGTPVTTYTITVSSAGQSSSCSVFVNN
ncbi:MAG: hypothetical protein ABL917_02315 [Parcubacteria group bacterium]